jgi:hypothetical protein
LIDENSRKGYGEDWKEKKSKEASLRAEQRREARNKENLRLQKGEMSREMAQVLVL